jgi:NADPH:quinone reductase-like Zn-dependent oxidoreductase
MPAQIDKADSKTMGKALWYVAPKRAELRTEPLPSLSNDHARLTMLWSGISRGTERLVFSGQVPVSEYEHMKAPLQQGQFPFPVKYGYCAVARVDEGPADLMGRNVFCLHPHQDQFNAPVAMLAALPAALPPRRAILTANMETALNALWDAGAGPADDIVIVGAGVVGLLTAAIAARMPGAQVTVVDISESRRHIVEALGATFALPDQTPQNADIVIHASASPAGLATAIGCAGLEATIIELSWYGDRVVEASLGGAFHSRRLKLISSQVGLISPGHRPRWSYQRRLNAAFNLLQDPRLDALITHEIAFSDLPAALPTLLASDASGLTAAVRYS